MRTEKAATAGMLQVFAVFGWRQRQDTVYPTLNFCIFTGKIKIAQR
jgi:hypothetical protein